MKKYSRVYVEITNICNRSCSFCPGTKRALKRMSKSELSYIAEKLRPHTDYLYFHLMGEPLTHPELPEFIRLSSDLGFKCAITTNGTLIKKRSEELLSSGVYKINISVHSFEEGSESDHLEYLESISDFARASSERGILTVFRLWNQGYDGGKNEKTISELRRLLPYEWVEGNRGFRIRDKLHLEYGERFDWPDSSLPEGGPSVFCYGLSDHFGILVDGSVVPCCLDREGDITLGNIFSESIEDILSSERAENIREGFKKRCAAESLCRKCGYARRF